MPQANQHVLKTRLTLYLLAFALVVAVTGGLSALVREQKRQNDLNVALFSAISNGDVARTETLLQRGANPNAPRVTSRSKQEGFGEQARRYWRRIRLGGESREVTITYPIGATRFLTDNPPGVAGEAYVQTRMIQTLVRHGADVNTAGTEGTLLLEIAHDNNIKAALTLLNAAGHPDKASGANQATPLMIAAKERHNLMARLLLAHGANPNSRDKFGATALHYAVNGGFAPDERTDTIALLLAHGADASARDKSGATARDKAEIHARAYGATAPGGAPYARAALLLRRAERTLPPKLQAGSTP